MRIGVVGAGHAGVEAAWRASRLGAQVVLFSREPVLPYFRPKVVTLAFGQAELDAIYLRPEQWYREHGIDLRLSSEVAHLDARARIITVGGQEERFDALVVATGPPRFCYPLPGSFPMTSFRPEDFRRLADCLGQPWERILSQDPRVSLTTE
jgi:3-phenylpropionate/trans-cinnamate dioxygenase ferredoxin reductase subunit